MDTRTIGAAGVAKMLAAQNENEKKRLAAGLPALDRLVKVALSDTGQSRVCGRFLLGLYNGSFYRFDLTDFRLIDTALFDDCIAVLQLDANPVQEVHFLIEDGEAVFYRLRMLWANANEVEGWSVEDRAQWQKGRG